MLIALVGIKPMDQDIPGYTPSAHILQTFAKGWKEDQEDRFPQVGITLKYYAIH